MNHMNSYVHKNKWEAKKGHITVICNLLLDSIY